MPRGRPRNYYKRGDLTPQQLEIRDLCTSDLKAFVALVAPQRVLGSCHHELLDFFVQTEADAQLVLWPRAHQKSMMMAYWVAWHVMKNPHTTVLYASDSARLAQFQLGVIKQIFDSTIFRKYWPELFKEEEGKRSMWRNDAIATDHWKRVEEVVRDPTVLAAGVGASLTGAHFDVLVLDDVVVYDNSETKEEREKVSTWYSLANSLLNPGGIIKAVGTRYHPQDLYQTLIEMEEEVFDEVEDKVVDTKATYVVSQRVVEIDGEFLWPRQRRQDGAWFGFNREQLSKKKANYVNKIQFYAQYYNNPSDPENKMVDSFEYYDRDHIREDYNGKYLLSNGEKNYLNVFAAIDFASTMNEKSDYTCIVVVGVDSDNKMYVLDIDRFKTDKISVMQEHLTKLYIKWKWLKLRGEATQAQNLVVNQIKDLNKKMGLFYNIENFKPIREKNLRIMTNLEPRYQSQTLFHYRGGNCQILEEELMSKRSAHDDVKDTLASVCEIVIPPIKRKSKKKAGNVIYHPKWGGVM